MKDSIRSCMFLTFFQKILKKKEIYAIIFGLYVCATAHTYKPRKNIQIVLKKVFVSFTETQKYTHIPQN